MSDNNVLSKYVIIQEDVCKENDWKTPYEASHKDWLTADRKYYYYPPVSKLKAEEYMVDDVPFDSSKWMKVPVKKIVLSES